MVRAASTRAFASFPFNASICRLCTITACSRVGLQLGTFLFLITHCEMNFSALPAFRAFKQFPFANHGFCPFYHFIYICFIPRLGSRKFELAEARPDHMLNIAFAFAKLI
jgi:hypothetical protein